MKETTIKTSKMKIKEIIVKKPLNFLNHFFLTFKINFISIY